MEKYIKVNKSDANKPPTRPAVQHHHSLKDRSKIQAAEDCTPVRFLKKAGIINLWEVSGRNWISKENHGHLTHLSHTNLAGSQKVSLCWHMPHQNHQKPPASSEEWRLDPAVPRGRRWFSSCCWPWRRQVGCSSDSILKLSVGLFRSVTYKFSTRRNENKKN